MTERKVTAFEIFCLCICLGTFGGLILSTASEPAYEAEYKQHVEEQYRELFTSPLHKERTLQL